MQTPPRFGLMRRILFPYSGEEPLTARQGLRVILVWALFFPLVMSLCTLAMAAALSISWSRIVELLLFAFLSGVFIFGGLSCLIVNMSNRAAHYRQAQKGTATNNIRGGRYGS